LQKRWLYLDVLRRTAGKGKVREGRLLGV